MAMCERVNQSTDLEVGLWATSFSEGFGTVSWTTFVPDLTALEAATDKLQVDDGYLQATDDGAALSVGGADDALFEVVHGEPDPSADPQYVTAVRAVCASGGIANGMVLGVELAQRAEAITGLSTMFVRNLTGAYAGVGWLTGYPSIEALEAAQAALAADPGWVEMIDARAPGAYTDDAAMTQQTIYRKLA
ncbi:MAG: hypothetical protein R2726_17380 [Acidimicrobiales bacterium]